MDRERLVFKALIEVPYTIDLDKHPKAETEDGTAYVGLVEDKDILQLSCYGEEIGVPRCIIEEKLKEIDLSQSEYWSALSYFEDNNSCDNEDYFIIKYDDMFMSTAVKDTNGEYIFEGSKVTYTGENKVFSRHFGSTLTVMWNKGKFCLYSPTQQCLLDMDLSKDITVVGHITDGVTGTYKHYNNEGKLV